MLFALVLACSSSAPTTPEDCQGLTDTVARDECYAVVLPPLFRTDPAKGIQLTDNAVSDQTVRDFIWLTVTREVDPNTNKYCDRIKDQVLAERCRVLVSRPHLHRGLVEGGRAPKTPMGGAPPGMAPPPPPGGVPAPGSAGAPQQGPGGPPPGPVMPGGASNGSAPPPGAPPAQ